MKKITVVIAVLFVYFGMNRAIAQNMNQPNVNQPGQPEMDSSRKTKGVNPSQSGLKAKGDTTNKWLNNKSDSLSRNNNSNNHNSMGDADTSRNRSGKKRTNTGVSKKDQGQNGSKQYNQKQNGMNGKRNSTSRDSVPR